MYISKNGNIYGCQRGKITHETPEGREVYLTDGSYLLYDKQGRLEKWKDVPSKCVRRYKNGRMVSRVGIGHYTGLEVCMTNGSERWSSKAKTIKQLTRRKNGRAIYAKTFYPNGRKRSFVKYYSSKPGVMWYPTGEVKAEFGTHMYDSPTKQWWKNGQVAMETRPTTDIRWRYFWPDGSLMQQESDALLLKMDRRGRVKTRIVYENRQIVGIAVENYEKSYYISGQKVSKKLYEQKPEEMTVNQILEEENANLRAGLLRKMGYERFLSLAKSKVVDTDKEAGMQMFDVRIPGVAEGVARFLQVTCPTTGQKYVLRVHPRSPNCEEARQWTFGNREFGFGRQWMTTRNLELVKET